MSLKPPEQAVGTLEQDNTVTLTWSRPVDSKTYFFRVSYKEHTSPRWISLDTPFEVNETHRFHTGKLSFAPLTEYDFKIISYNNLIVEGQSAAVTVKTGEAAPTAAPTNLRTTYIELDTIAIAWDPPEVTNGRLVEYTVHCDEEGEDDYLEFRVPAPTTTFEHNHVEPGTPYRFQVTAANSVGDGPPSQILRVRTPENVRARARRGSSHAREEKDRRLSPQKVNYIRPYVPPALPVVDT